MDLASLVWFLLALLAGYYGARVFLLTGNGLG